MEELKDQSFNSESTMIANQTFNDIVNKVQNSHLNYQLQLSPFSAVISLKKSLVKNRFGQIVIPKTTCDASESKLLYEEKNMLEKDMLSLQEKYESMINNHEIACLIIKMLG